MKGMAIVSVLLLLIAFSAGIYFIGNAIVPGSIVLPAELTGFTTLSLSNADFQSTSSYFSGKTWILYVQQGGLGQRAIGTIDGDVIGDKSGTSAENDLTINIDYTKQACEYPIKIDYTAQKIEKFGMVTWGCTLPPSQTDAQQRCGETMKYYGKFQWTFECFCIQASQSYPVGYLDSVEVHTQSTIKVSAKGEEYSKTIDTKSSIDGFVGDNVFVSWAGYKSTATACSSSDPYRAVYYGGSWRTVSASKYSQYVVQRVAFSTLLGGDVSKDQLLTQIGLINTAANNAIYTYSFGTIENPSSSTGGRVIRDLNTMVSIPTYVFYVKAAWLGIYQPIGKPDITKVEAPDFKTGEQGHVTVHVKNIGNEAEGFNSWLICPSPFSVSATQTKTVSPGDTKQFIFTVTSDTSEKVTKTCTAHVESIEYTDSMSFSLTSDPQKVCSPVDSFICDGYNVMYCNEWGSSATLSKQCNPDTEECALGSDGQAYCKKKNLNCAQDGESPIILIKPCCDGLKEQDGVCSRYVSVKWLNLILAGLVVSALIIVLLLALGWFFPPLRFFWKFFFNWKNLIAIWLIMAIALILILSVPTLTAASLIMGVLG